MKNIAFGQFQLDLANECLRQGPRAIALRPKAFAILKILTERQGELVRTNELLEAVWPGTFVGDAVLKGSIRQLREALSDDAASPSYIETVHRRGYRFIAAITSPAIVNSAPAADAPAISSAAPQTTSACTQPAAALLGRDAELKKLQTSLDQVRHGERQTVFITGEAGIGKTTLVEAFLQQALHVPGSLVIRGQCLEHFGSSEAYLPVLEGFSRLCRSAEGSPVLEVLRSHAPSWLAHMGSLVSSSERETLQASATGASRERMLREMAESIELLSQSAPVLLVLEDLHWSDYSTLDLIAHLSRRRDPARVMIVGTYRPVEVILSGHPLKNVKRELQAHRLCHELPLEYLSEEAITGYLSGRFPGHQFSSRLRQAIYRRTEGNPLFMVNLVDYLVDRNVIAGDQQSWQFCRDCEEVEHGIPSNIRELIEKQMEKLSGDERLVLEAASTTGMDFSIVAVAAGLERPLDWVEKHCEELALRHRFLTPASLGQFPDGTVSPRHCFRHVLYREVPYSLISPMRRVQIHQRIAERGIEIYGERSAEIAAELAMHFEQSRDWARAVEYLILAVKNASRRSAHHEATELARRGLELLKLLPETTERAHQEVNLRMMECISLIAVKGFAAAEVDKIYAMGRELFWSAGPSAQLSNILYLLLLFYLFSGKIDAAHQTAEQLVQMAEALAEPALIMEAHRALGSTLIELGKCAEALEHLDFAAGLYSSHRSHHTLTIAHDCKVICDCFAARALWTLGNHDLALARIQRAVAFAKELAQPRSWAIAAHFAVQLHQLRGEHLQALASAHEVERLADEYGMDFWGSIARIDLGWCQAELGDVESGIELMRRGLDEHMASGARLWCPQFLAQLARQLEKAGRLQESHDAAVRGQAIAHEGQELYPLPELSEILRDLETQMLQPAHV